MTKFKIIIFVTLILAIIAMIFWAYPTIKERYFEEESNKEETTENITKQKENKNLDTNKEDETEEEFESEEDENEITPAEEDEPFLEITLKDCSENCKKYEKDLEDFEYCRQICGLSEKKIETEDCADLEGLKEDYCWKDQAVSKLDFNLCDRIADKGLHRICINQITEEVLNGKSEKSSLPE